MLAALLSFILLAVVVLGLVTRPGTTLTLIVLVTLVAIFPLWALAIFAIFAAAFGLLWMKA